MPADPVAPPPDGVFTVGRRGYEPQQVDAHLRRLDAEIRILVADRDAAVDQAAQLGRELDEARLRADRLRTQVRTMAARPSDVQGMSERMRTMLRLAEDEVADMLRRADAEVARRRGEVDASAEDVVAAAQREADRIREAARAEAEEVTAAAARTRADTEAACAADRQRVADERAAAEREIARSTEEANQEQARVWADSEARRTTVEEDFHIAMDQRRAEAFAEVHAERARTAEWVQRSREETTRQCRAQLDAAEETARRIVASAEERVAELADVRGRIAAQLHGTQAELGSLLAALAPEPSPALPAAPGSRPDEEFGATTDDVAPDRADGQRESEATTRPIPVADPHPGTLVLGAPAPSAVARVPAQPTATREAPSVPGNGAAEQPVPDQSLPLDADARRADSRRRRRRSATGATRR